MSTPAEVEAKLTGAGFKKADYFIGVSDTVIWVYVTRWSRLLPIRKLFYGWIDVIVEWHGKPKPLESR